MDAVISDIRSAVPNFKTLRVEAQDYTIPFYEKMGFTVVGDGFLGRTFPITQWKSASQVCRE
jgi:predicted GNAT family N-acyltransferase